MTEAIDPHREMVTVTWPDPVLRPIPSFSFDSPPDWILTEFPDSLFLLAPAEDAPEPWTNITVRHERVFRDTTMGQIARDTWEALKRTYEGIELGDERMLTVNGNMFYIRESEFYFEGYETRVTRHDAFIFGPNIDHTVVDLFQFIFLNAAEHTEAYKPLFLRMLGTLEIEE